MNIFESLFKPFLKDKTPIKTTESPIPEEHQLLFASSVDSQQASTTDENDTIKRCRRILSNEIEAREAVEDIKNDAIVEEDGKKIFEPAFMDESIVSKNLIDMFKIEWNELYNNMELYKKIGIYWEAWYRDGKLPMELIYDKNNLESGIIKAKQISPLHVKLKNTSKGYEAYFESTVKIIGSIPNSGRYFENFNHRCTPAPPLGGQ
jgi:hypothetical protein